MARILLGWELGAGTGHTVALARIAAMLRARGHDPLFAAQDIAAFAPDEEVWQAPLWPQQLTIRARPSDRGPSTMGDILAVLGLAEGRALAAMIGAWDRILAAARPDAVAAEYAPALMLAARGRVPVVALGTGFSLPPAHMDAFLSLTGDPAMHDEAPLLAAVNRALAERGRAPLAALPQIFAADVALPAVFSELDPYRSVRRGSHGVPSLSGLAPLSAGDGDELFVYMNGSQARPLAFWRGLAESGVPVRVHDPRLTAADCAALERAGITVEIAKVPIDRIVERSRLVMSHGGLGFTCSALLAGIPHIVAPFDLEKRLISATLGSLGLGVETRFDGMDAGRFADLLRTTMADQPLVDRARAAAPAFRARITRSSADEAADAIEGLLP